MSTLEDEGVRISYMLAGLFGSLMMMSKVAGLTPKRTILATIGGAASANYLTPLILHIAKIGQNPDDISYSFAIAFLLGFLGLRAIELITSKLITDESTHDNKRHR
jgi:hypothetical protein